MAKLSAPEIPAILPLWRVHDLQGSKPGELVTIKIFFDNDVRITSRNKTGNWAAANGLTKAFQRIDGGHRAIGQSALATDSTADELHLLDEATLVEVVQVQSVLQIKIVRRVRISDVTKTRGFPTARWTGSVHPRTLREKRRGTPWPRVPVIPPRLPVRRAELSALGRSQASCTSDHLSCSYWSRCMEALEHIFVQSGLPLERLGGQGGRNPAEDRCFCAACHRRRADKMVYQRGGKDYVQPVGFSRIAFRPAKSGCVSQVGFSEWHVCYHGTTHRSVVDIVKQGHLLAPGTHTYLGTQIKVRSGHLKFPMERRNLHTGKTEIFDPRTKVFFSPSARYCEYGHVYTDDFPWAGRRYRCILQVRVQPGTYQVGQETVGLMARSIDSHIPNSSIEWYSDQLHCHFITGVLLKELV